MKKFSLVFSSIILVVGCTSTPEKYNHNLISNLNNQTLNQPPGIGGGSVLLEFSGEKLKQVIQDIHNRSNIVFDLPAQIADRKIKISGNYANWNSAIQSLLLEYNHVGIIDINGQLKRVIITGLVGAGKENGLNSPASLFNYTVSQGSLSQQNLTTFGDLNQLPTNSVFPIQFDSEALTSLSKGDILNLNLPTGQYQVVHDNLLTHSNGDSTWVGYLQEEGKNYRAIITLGENGILGRITTPDGVFKIETDGHSERLIDINASGVTPVALLGDGLIAHDIQETDIEPFSNKVINGMLNHEYHGPMVHYDTLEENDSNGVLSNAKNLIAETDSELTSTKTLSNNFTSADATTVNRTLVDVMMLYTPAMQNYAALQTRINHLISLTNQAYIDSQVQIELRLVHTELINYSDTNSNSTALTALTENQGVFAGIENLRQQHGADLVSLVRPFNVAGQINCGVAWVGGSNGQPLRTQLGYSVVSDGRDNNYYCTDYTFSHELGHNMGSVHDRANSNMEGKYSYSFGYGVVRKFGTIMSYLSPEIGVFSNPDLNCGLSGSSSPCGTNENDADSANNALSLNNTRTQIADFVSTVYVGTTPDPTPNPDPTLTPLPTDDPEPTIDPGSTPGPSVSAFGNDFDGDGNSDVIWRKGSKKIQLWLMNGSNVKSSLAIDPIPYKRFKAIVVGDFDGDNNADLLWRYARKGTNKISLMNDGEIVSTLNIPKASKSWRIIKTADFNNDGKTDLIWQHKKSKKYVLWLMDNNTIISSTNISLDSKNWIIIGSADFNQDGNADNIWLHHRSREVQIVLMSGDSQLSTIELPKMSKVWRLAKIGDFNGDGSQDMLLRHKKNGKTLFWFFDNTQLTNQKLTKGIKNRKWKIVSSADYNGDGSSDIMWKHRNGEVFTQLLDGVTILETKKNLKLKSWVPLM